MGSCWTNVDDECRVQDRANHPEVGADLYFITIVEQNLDAGQQLILAQAKLVQSACVFGKQARVLPIHEVRGFAGALPWIRLAGLDRVHIIRSWRWSPSNCWVHSNCWVLAQFSRKCIGDTRAIVVSKFRVSRSAVKKLWSYRCEYQQQRRLPQPGLALSNGDNTARFAALCLQEPVRSSLNGKKTIGLVAIGRNNGSWSIIITTPGRSMRIEPEL